jgi:hypothetical protein
MDYLYDQHMEYYAHRSLRLVPGDEPIDVGTNDPLESLEDDGRSKGISRSIRSLWPVMSFNSSSAFTLNRFTQAARLNVLVMISGHVSLMSSKTKQMFSGPARRAFQCAYRCSRQVPGRISLSHMLAHLVGIRPKSEVT